MSRASMRQKSGSRSERASRDVIKTEAEIIVRVGRKTRKRQVGGGVVDGMGQRW